MGTALLALLILPAGCGSEVASPSIGDPVFSGSVLLRAAGEAGPGELENRHLTAGRSFEVLKYDIPDLPCVRTDSDDYLHIPDGTASPGAPAVFYAVPPAGESMPVMVVFHGNGLAFMEAEASLFTHTFPDAAEWLAGSVPMLIGYTRIMSRDGAVECVEGEMGSANVAEALERGWGVVLPGNCWGDGGYGEGEIVDYYIQAARYGHEMDARAWEWFRSEFPHDSRREYSFGCSGGGQRTAQLLLHDPLAVAAGTIDSPADYLPGFKDDPPSLFLLMSLVPGYKDVLDGFYIQQYGGFDAAGRQSLGTQMAVRGIETPIYLAYSTRDPMITNAISGRLVEALGKREPAERSNVWNSEAPDHCQINTRERAGTALDWIGRWTRDDS